MAESLKDILREAHARGEPLAPLIQAWRQKHPEAIVNLSGADLTGADLSGADLRWSDLTGADLWRANLSGADLTGADLTGADLTGADLWGARGDEDTIFTGAKMGGSLLAGFSGWEVAQMGRTNRKRFQEANSE